MDRFYRLWVQARVGSDKRLEQLLDTINYQPTEKKLILLRIFISHLELRHVPTLPKFRDPDPEELQRIENAASALMGVAAIITSVYRWWAMPEYHSTFLAAWPGMWAWARLFATGLIFNQVDVPPEYATGFDVYRSHMLEKLERSALVLVQYSSMAGPLLPMLGNTEGFVACITRLWIREASIPFAIEPYRTNIALHSYIQPDKPNWVRIIVGTAGTPVDLANYFVMHVDGNLRQEEPSYMALDMCIQMMMMLARGELLGLKEAFLSRTPVDWIIYLLDQILVRNIGRQPRNSPCGVFDVDHARKCLSHLLQYLRYVLCAKPGIIPVGQALEAQVLPLLLQIACQYPSITQSHVCDLLGLLSPYLIYRSLVRPAMRSLNRISAMGLEKHTQLLTDLGPMWDKFKDLVNNRWMLKNAFTEQDKSAQKCRRCRRRDVKLRRCSRCDALYCSERCQKYDWTKSGHREVCDLTRKRDIDREFTQRDLGYFRHLERYIFHRSQVDIHVEKQKAIDANPGVNFDALVVVVDHRAFPVSIKVSCDIKSIKAIHHSVTETMESFWKDAVGSVKKEKGRYGIVISQLPYGSEIKIHCQIVDWTM